LYDGLSGASLRTGDVGKITKYMVSMVENKEGVKRHWNERLSKKASASRRV
jgi:hypothetical protein